MALTTAAAVAGTAAYLDAKYHIRKDLSSLLNLRRSTAAVTSAATSNRASLLNFFLDTCARMPEGEECIWTPEGTLTWREVHNLACKYARFLREELRVEEGELVGFCLTNGVPYVVSLLATWAIGTAPAQLNYNLGGEGLIHCIKVSGCKVLLVDEDAEVIGRVEEVRAKVEEMGVRIVVLDRERRSMIEGMKELEMTQELRKNVKIGSTLMLIYTSGTTGFPKAVPFTHGRLIPSMQAYYEGIGLIRGPGGSRFYVPMPMYHGTAAHATMMSLCCGATLCIGKKFSASRFWPEIRASKATAFVYVGETARYLLAAPPSPRDKEHSVKVAWGNGMRPDVFEKFMDRFGIEVVSEFFNSSEGIFGMVNYSCRGPFYATSVGHHGAILRALQHNTIVPVIIDHTTSDIQRDPITGFATRSPYSIGGEILIAMPPNDTSAFSGYYKNPSATGKKFVRDVFKKGDLYYRTGDALRRDDDGRWYFLDRLGDTFRWKSENVSTAEVAAVLGTYPGIVEANVYGVLVPGHDGRAGCAAIYISEDARRSFDYKDLAVFLRKRLPKYAVPVFLRLLGEISPMHNQKQNKVPLREEGVDVEKVAKGSKEGRVDEMMWLRPGSDGYEGFGKREWDLLVAEKAKL